jgi:hypothetical protein
MAASLCLLLALGTASAQHVQIGISATQFFPIGHRVDRIPRSWVSVTVGTGRYRYHDGVFYRPDGRRGYIVVGAPIGAHVRTLPRGYVGFGLSGRNYFYVNSTYYLWEPDSREYVVVAEPDGAAQAMTADTQPAGRVFAYPNEGQTEDELRKDRYECHLWAADESGYDPTYSNQPENLHGDYNRALTACLVGRGYTVR